MIRHMGDIEVIHTYEGTETMQTLIVGRDITGRRRVRLTGRASVSLWSADQLALGAAVDALDGHVDGFHIDVMDGHFAPDLLYGPATVQAVAARARRSLVDVHLVVEDADRWIAPFAEAGAGCSRCTPSAAPTRRPRWRRSRRAACAPAWRSGWTASSTRRWRPAPTVCWSWARRSGSRAWTPRRGDPGERVRRVRALGAREVFVDGGIREHTIGALAAAGADGVVPGSLVFGRPDWLAGVRLVAAA